MRSRSRRSSALAFTALLAAVAPMPSLLAEPEVPACPPRHVLCVRLDVMRLACIDDANKIPERLRRLPWRCLPLGLDGYPRYTPIAPKAPDTEV